MPMEVLLQLWNDASGCTDPGAVNFDPFVSSDDGSCWYYDINTFWNSFDIDYMINDSFGIYVSNNYKTRIYIPFGPDWYDYSIRRIKENPKIATYVINNLFRK